LPALRLGSQSWAAERQSPSPSLTNPKGQNDPRENLRNRWRDLLAEVEKAEPVALAGALQAEGLRRFDALLSGVEKYRRHPQSRSPVQAPVLWSQGTTRLLDYRAGRDPKAPRLLVIPSLVNRYYILDLEAEASFLRWCAAQGMAPSSWIGARPAQRSAASISPITSLGAWRPRSKR
jgi:polyhydroxyalkanoate synthase